MYTHHIPSLSDKHTHTCTHTISPAFLISTHIHVHTPLPPAFLISAYMYTSLHPARPPPPPPSQLFWYTCTLTDTDAHWHAHAQRDRVEWEMWGTDGEIQSAFSWPARVHFLALCKRALMSGTWKMGGIEDASSRCFFFFSCHLIFILLDFSKVCAAFCQPLWNSFCLEYKVRCYKITRTFKRTSLLILCIYISSKRCANRGWKFTKFTQYINKFNFTKDYKRSIPLHNSVNINRQII